MAGYGRPYGRAPAAEEEEALLGIRSEEHERPKSSHKRAWTVLGMTVLMGGVVFAAGYLVFGYGSSRSVSPVEGSHPDGNLGVFSAGNVAHQPQVCNSVNGGYECFSNISHRWGQYSPYFSVEEEGISGDVPNGCEVTFVQLLSRHGARYPTASKSKKYAELVADIQANATEFKGRAAFLKDYNYTLGSDDLTTFGERQMIDSGIKFYERYASLTRDRIPFIRSSNSSRVVESAKKFIQGFQQTKNTDKFADRDQNSPQINVLISESTGSNNSLNHNTCPTFEASSVGDDVADSYTARIAPPIAHRIEKVLPGVTLSNDDVTSLMDMCAFDTISTTDGSKISAFCDLFTLHEWTHYNYLQSLAKYYGYGAGNPLGPTQGVGFVNELIARMTHTPVHDDTSTNHALDSSATTFPLNRTLYADFTHDNGLIPIYFAMGLYNGTATLPTKHLQSASGADGFSAAWTVPFAARAYVEMMQCSKDKNAEPLVRVLVNDRVVPLHGCDVDRYGRCRRKDFINGLSFARDGGDWDKCYS